MVNIYLFIELLHTASAVTTVDTLKAMQMDNCKFANVVVLSEEKLVAQLDCQDFDRRRQGDAHQDRQGRRRGADQHHRRGPPQSDEQVAPRPPQRAYASGPQPNARLPNCRLSGRRP